MVNYRPDALWPWLLFRLSDDTTGFGMAPDGTSPMGLALMAGAYGSLGQAGTPVGGGELGLSNRRPSDSNLSAPTTMSPSAQGPDMKPWFYPQGKDETIRPALNWPWLRAVPEDNPSGFHTAGDGTRPTALALMAGAYDSPYEATTPADGGNQSGLSNWRPQDTAPGFRLTPAGSNSSAPTGAANASELDWRPPGFGLSGPFEHEKLAPFVGQPSEPRLGTWSRVQEQGGPFDDHPYLRWPWLRTEPEDDPPGLRMNPDGSINQSDPSANIKLMSGAYVPADDPAVAEAGRSIGANTLDPLQRTTDVGGLMAMAAAAPMEWTADAAAGSQSIRTAIGELAALAGRAAPIAARAASGPAAALPVLVLPANSGDETISLGDGLRARRIFQQRTVEIERRIDNGLLGIGARWEKLPVTAVQAPGEDGSPRVMIDGHELEKAVGPEAAARAWDAIGSAMSRPPKKQNEEDESKQPAGTESKSSQTQGQGGGNKPPLGPGPLTTAAEVATRAIEDANKPRSDAQQQAELVEGWRQILKSRGEQAPDGQYRGEGGYMTALGVRMPPDVGEPAAGREVFPEQEHLRKGVIGEYELVNRIKAVRPDEVILHFGNAPGVQGPDVLSIGRGRTINIWDSKSRSAARSVGPSMAASPSLDRERVTQLVMNAIDEGRLSAEVGFEALQKFYDGNYNVLTVGTDNAHNGLVEFFRNHKSSGARRH